MPFEFEDDVGSNNSGYYTLHAVITHQGRSSSSGHYVSWVRQSQTEDIWYEFDDDGVSQTSSKEILRLSGGAPDWHCAYILLYAPSVIKLSELNQNYFQTVLKEKEEIDDVYPELSGQFDGSFIRFIWQNRQFFK